MSTIYIAMTYWPFENQRFWHVALLCCLGVSGPRTAAGTDVSILVDGSGSMEGFQQTGELQKLLTALKKACQDQQLEAGTLFFVSQHPDSLVWNEAESHQIQGAEWGSYTNLLRAFEEGLGRSPITFFLTDNVQATTNDEDIRELYARFAEDVVQVLYAVPLSLPFDGRLFNHPDKAHHQGPRGAVLYAYLTEEDQRARFGKLISELKAGGLEPMLMKPLDHRIVLHRKRRAYSDQPSTIGMDESESVHFSFTLESQLSYLNIEPTDERGNQVRLKVSQPRIVPMHLEDRRYWSRASGRGRVTPPRLEEKLEHNTQNKYRYSCRVRLGPFLPNEVGFFDQLGMARISPIPAQYMSKVVLEIPPGSFRMTPAYQEKYFTDNPQEVERIYTPEDLIHFLHRDREDLEVVPKGGAIRGRLQVRSPFYLWWAWVAVILLPVAVVAAGGTVYFRRLVYRLADVEYKYWMRPGGQKELEYTNQSGKDIVLGYLWRDGLFKCKYRLLPAEEGDEGAELRNQIDDPVGKEGVAFEKDERWFFNHKGNRFELERLK